MGNSQYAHLVKPLSIKNLSGINAEENPASGPGNAAFMFRMNGREHLEGMHLNLAWGIHANAGKWHGDMDPHVHSSPECLLFVGLDTASIKYLGAEISICLGEEQETYTFNEPTMVVLPPGMPHGPITTDRMFSPRGFGCWSVSLHSEPDITWMGKGVSSLSSKQRQAAPEGMRFTTADKILDTAPTQPTGKYAHLVKPLKPSIFVERRKVLPERAAQVQSKQQGKSHRPNEKPGPGSADHLIWLTGKDLEGLNATIAWGLCSQPGISRRGVGAHAHPVDEVLVYMGMDPQNINSLGAEIEVDLGKEHERHLINEPAAIVCRAGMPHMPSVTHWVDRPYAFFAVCLSGEHEAEAFD